VANGGLWSSLGAPVAADVTGHAGWPHVQRSSLQRILWPSSIVRGEAFSFSASLALTLAQRVFSSLREEAAGPGTASGPAAPASRRVPPQCQEPEHRCGHPTAAARSQGSPASQALQRPPRSPLLWSTQHFPSEVRQHPPFPNSSAGRFSPSGFQGCCVLQCPVPVCPRGSTPSLKRDPSAQEPAAALSVCRRPPTPSGPPCSSPGQRGFCPEGTVTQDLLASSDPLSIPLGWCC